MRVSRRANEGSPLRKVPWQSAAMSGQGTVQRPAAVLFHPLVFITCWVSLGTVFAIQDWINFKRWGYKISTGIVFASWDVEYLIWGILFWILGYLFWPTIQKITIRWILVGVLPLSILVTLIKTLLWVPWFPSLPIRHTPMSFWRRFDFHLSADFVEDMVIFWCTFALFRGAGYYESLRKKERIAVELEAQLANARLSALRMQLNPHFLFNAMNSISSLMHTDVTAADEMLEQLSSLLRMSLERRNVQLITLHEELDFLEVYLQMQDRRYAGRLARQVVIPPDLHDAVVPAMVLQPIVENAFVHGLSKIERGGELLIEARTTGAQLILTVINSGPGLRPIAESVKAQGIGIANIESRLHLHYQNAASLTINEVEAGKVRVKITLPLTFSTSHPAQDTRFGVE